MSDSPEPPQTWTDRDFPTEPLPEKVAEGLFDVASAPSSEQPPEPRSARVPPPTPEELQASFPQYEILSLLGRGGMGAVYKARHKSLDRFVALKLLSPELSEDREFAGRFQREARAMARLAHPNIITVHDFGQTAEGRLYFAMEFVDGLNLQVRIREGGLSPKRALNLASQICDALAYAHGEGVVHRDIKPSNVMVDLRDRVKVADFGLVRVIAPDVDTGSLTSTGTVMGTLDYMAPEQKRGMQVDHRADIYSLGVMLYEMVCREVPHGVFAPPSERTGCDPRIDEIVTTAMQQEPELRYQSTHEMKAAVDSILMPASPSTRTTVPPPRLPRPSAKFPRAAILGGLLLFAGGVWWAIEGKGTGALLRPFLPSVPLVKSPRTWVNSLGMKFVPVPIKGGPSDGQSLLFSVWEVRVQDYEVFRKEQGVQWPPPSFPQEPTHPAVNVTWEGARTFCLWLTARERKSGHLRPNELYRLPTDHEWSCAAGIGEQEDLAHPPKGKNRGIDDVYPWGSAWPPPADAGNYSGKETEGAMIFGPQKALEKYRDSFVYTAPVGSFRANPLGLYDLGGNVWEWCEDFWGPGETKRVVRGAAFSSGDQFSLLSSQRLDRAPERPMSDLGFRPVIATEGKSRR